jgi:hypothetical protein
MSNGSQYPIESELSARVLALYPALMVLIAASLIDWTTRSPMHTISGMLLVAGAYSAFRAFQMRHRKFDKVSDTKAIAYWIYGTSVALVALLASTTFRASIWLLIMTAVVMIMVIKRNRFPVVTKNNAPPRE